MRISWNRVLVFFASLMLLHSIARADDTNQPPRLTVELGDGSRVVGMGVDKRFRFHSSLLGDLKLAIKDVRSVDRVSSNAVKLVTADGDTLTVAFVDSSLELETGFGKVSFRSDSVRHIAVSAASGIGMHPPGLVALWPGENDGRDVIGHNDAELMDISFAEGQVGQAFSLNGFSSWLKIPASPVLDVGQGDGLTITAWIKPADVTSFRPILEWNTTTRVGVHLWLGHLPGQQGELFANLFDTERNAHSLNSPQGTIVNGKFQHVALTYDKASGVAILFANGVVVARGNVGTFTPQTSLDLCVSRRPGDHPGDWTYNAFFEGLIDEIGIYNRALSAEEIQTLCRNENHGELPPAPNPATGPGIRFNGAVDRGGFSP